MVASILEPENRPLRPNGDQSGTHSIQSAVAELGQAALLNHDVTSVFRSATDLLCEVLGVEYAKVLHQPEEGNPLVLMAGRGWDDHIKVGETIVPCDLNSQAGYTLLSDEPVFVEDLAAETRFAGPQLLCDHNVIAGMSVVIQGIDRPYGVLGVHTAAPRRFTFEEGDFLRSVANVLGSAIQNQRFVEQIERRVRYETALAECAQALLASRGDDRIDLALEALLTATEATYVFLERNVVDPELGFCSQAIAEVEQPGTPGYDLDNEYWELVPWERMPVSRRNLEKGKPFVVVPEELEGPEYELYAADPFPVKAELDIPIFVDGEWAGLIGFADRTAGRHWSDTDLSLLTTAARMIGAFWERDVARERLEQMNRAKDEFLASVSHELRTPLTSVMGYAQLLRDHAEKLTTGEQREATEAVLRQAADLTSLVSDLLVAAKADMGQLSVSRVPVTLRAQAAQVLEEFDVPQLPKIRVSGHAQPAIGDPARVRQILRNLLTNARRYGGHDIRIKISGGNSTALVRVTDDGPGIPPEEREEIFERHHRSQAAPGLTAALGLGLSISRELARLMGGDLIYRRQRERSVFELSLPTS
jgi:signal transduction histidine kinase